MIVVLRGLQWIAVYRLCAADEAAEGFDARLAFTKCAPLAAANPNVLRAAAIPTGPKAASKAATGAATVAATAASTTPSAMIWDPRVA